MSVVGRAYVNVRAVTRQVEPDIQRGVDGALDRVSNRVAADSGKKLGDSIGEGVKESRISEKIEESVRTVNTDRSGSELGGSIGDSIFNSRGMNIAARLTELWDKAMPDLESDGKKRGKTIGDKVVGGIAGSLASMAVNPMLWAGIAIPPAITQGFTLVSASAAAATEIVSTLGPVLATLGTTGAAAIGTLAATVGTLTLAFKVQSDELAGFKEQLTPIADDFRGIGVAIQRDLLPALGESANRINAALGDEVRAGLLLTADSVGGLAARFTRLTETPFFQDNIARIMESNAVSLSRFGGAGVNVAGILADIGASAGPSVERVAEAVRNLTGDLFSSTRGGAANGSLAAFFDDAVDTTFQWGRILGDVSSALFDIFSIGAGGTLLSSLEGVTDRFRDWADSASGQGSIQEWFDQARPVMSAVGDLMGSLGSAVADLSGDTGALVSTLEAVTGGMPGLASGVDVLSTSFAGIIGIVAPLIAELASRLAPAVAEASDAFQGELGPALERIVDPLGSVIENTLALADNLAPAAGLASKVLAPALDVAATALEGFDAALDLIPGPVTTLAATILGLRLAFSRLASSTGPVGTKFATYRAQMAATRAANQATATSFAGLRAAATTTTAALGGGLGIGIAAAAIAYGVFAGKSASARAEMEAITDTLDTQTGAWTENTAAHFANSLEKDGELERLQKLGISTSEYIDAIRGEGDAYDGVISKLRDLKSERDSGIQGNEVFTLGLMDSGETKEIQDRIDKLEEERQTYLDSRAAFRREAAAQEDSGVARERAIGSIDRFLGVNREIPGVANRASAALSDIDDSSRDLGRGVDGADRQLKQMARTIYAVNDAAIKHMQGQIGFRQAIADANKQFRESRDTLSLYNQAGRDNQSSLLGIATAAQAVTGSAEKQQKALKEARSEILELALAKTNDEDKAKKLTNQIFDLTKEYNRVPGDVNTEVKSPTLQSQLKAVRALINELESLDGTRYDFGINGPAGDGDDSGTPLGIFNDIVRPGNPVGSPGAVPGGTGSRRVEVSRSADDRRERTGGVNFNGPINVQPHNYRDFLRELEGKTRATQLQGYGGPGGNL